MIITDILWIMGAWVFGIALLIFVVNFLTKGFLIQYLIVKASQGRKILMRVHSATDIYFVIGKWEDGFLKFKNRAKEKKSVAISDVTMKVAIQSTLGVFLVEIDESGDKIINTDWDVVKFEVPAGVVDNLIYRIKNRPQPKSKQELIIMVLCFIILLAVAFCLFKIFALEQIITELGKLSGNIQ